MVAFSAEECFRFRFICTEYGYRHRRLTVKGNVEVFYEYIGSAEVVKDTTQRPWFIRAHIDGQYLIIPALVALFPQFLHGLRRIVDNQADNAEFGTVIGQHRVYIDICISQYARQLAQGAIRICCKTEI